MPLKSPKNTVTNMAASSPYLLPDICLIIMAKAPVPGQVKTRLIPTLGQENAAKLYRTLLRETTGKMLESRICPMQIWCHPNVEHPDFLGLEQQGASLFQQQGNDLGERMHHALAQALQISTSVVVIGCDCPLMTPEFVQTAFADLSGETFDAVLGPAEDGGYYLLGLKKTEQSLFQNVSWGTAEVLHQTRNNLIELGWRWSELNTLWDLDRPEDFSRFQKLNPNLNRD